MGPDEAEQWMKDMERVFDGKRSLVENRLANTIYMLIGEA